MILLTGDLHLSDNPRDAYRDQWVSKLPALARKLKADTAIIAGDLTEEKDRHGAWLVNRVASHLYELGKVCPVVVYMGNHDYVDIDNPFFEFLRYIENVDFIKEPMRTGIGHVGEVLILPHSRSWRKDWEHVDETGCNYVFAHQTFKGAVIGNGRVATDGPPDDFFDKKVPVLSGDVHTPQRAGRVTYVGAPYTVDFGDEYEPRVLTLTKDKVTSVPCVGPQKRMVTWPMNAREEWTDKAHGTSKGDVVKVRIEIDTFDQQAWSELVDITRRWADAFGVQLYAVQPVVIAPDGKRVSRKRNSLERKDDKQTVAKFSKSRGVDEPTIKTGYYLMDRSK